MDFFHRLCVPTQTVTGTFSHFPRNFSRLWEFWSYNLGSFLFSENFCVEDISEQVEDISEEVGKNPSQLGTTKDRSETMTSYQGGKKNIGRHIAGIINQLSKSLDIDAYFEPMCGMCGVLRHVKVAQRYASDINKDLILLLEEVQNFGVQRLPTTCTKATWLRLKESKEHSSIRGFLGICASWGGIWFQGYRLEYTSDRNYLEEGKKNLKDLKKDIKGVIFLDADSYDSQRPGVAGYATVEKYIIYFDPPYQGNELGNTRSVFQTFDHEKFWEDCRTLSKRNLVLISEKEAPDDFIPIWEKDSYVHNKNGYKTKQYCDRLFVHKKWLKKVLFALNKE